MSNTRDNLARRLPARGAGRIGRLRGGLPLRGEAGLTLIEILIALFIFMVGAVSIFALVPVGMDQATRTLEQRRANVIAQWALTTLESETEPQAPLFRGVVASSTDNSATVSPNPGWPDDHWQGRHAVAVLPDGSKQSGEIDSNTADRLNIAGTWGANPPAGSRINIVPYYEERARRSSIAAEVAATTLLVTDPDLHVDFDQAAADTGNYFILITSGRAKGRICLLTGVDEPAAGSQRLTASGADFAADRVRAGDSFVILGNSSGFLSWPENEFGTAGEEQTAPDPSNPASDFRFVVIFSDPGALGAGAFHPVRADVLVFRIYDNGSPPDRNRRAAAIRTAYIPMPLP